MPQFCKTQFGLKSLLVLVAACAGICWLSVISIKYHNKSSLERRLIIALRHRDTYELAQMQLLQMGSVAVPALIEELRTDVSGAQFEAALILGQMGTTASPAIPALLESLKDRNEHLRYAAFQALQNISPHGEVAIPTLIELLDQGGDSMKLSAAAFLARLGPNGKHAIRSLKCALNNDSPVVRIRSAFALFSIEGDADSFVPAILEMFHNPTIHLSGEFREAAAVLLGSSSKNDDAIEQLKLLHTDTDPNVRLSAAYSLWKIAPESPESISTLTTLLRYEDPLIRKRAALTIGLIGPGAKSQASWALSWALEIAENDGDEAVRRAVAGAIEKLNRED